MPVIGVSQWPSAALGISQEAIDDAPDDSLGLGGGEGAHRPSWAFGMVVVSPVA
jgi:hypothetical protein